MKHFKQLFPIHQAIKQLSNIMLYRPLIYYSAKEETLKRSYFVLHRRGDFVHTESSDYLTVL